MRLQPARRASDRRCATHLCKSHEHYAMTCADFAVLLDHAQGRCEACGAEPAATPHGMLHIDHDSRLGEWAVRGLLCSRCNTALGDANDADSALAAYAAAPWWAEHFGLRAAVPPPEPPDGTAALVNILGRQHRWIRAGEWWHHMERGPRRPLRSWHRLCRNFGPHNIQVIDSPAATSG